MRKTSVMARCLVLCLGLSGAGRVVAADTPAAATTSAAVDVVSAEFGLFEETSAQELAFQPTLDVPHKVGQRYGWVIELRTSKRSVEVIEEYVLPARASANPAAADDAVRESLDVSVPRRNRVSQRQLVPVEGRIYGEWGVGPREPAGPRVLQVTIEGQLAATFRYEVK